jgi:hypothetical protein
MEPKRDKSRDPLDVVGWLGTSAGYMVINAEARDAEAARSNDNPKRLEEAQREAFLPVSNLRAGAG